MRITAAGVFISIAAFVSGCSPAPPAKPLLTSSPTPTPTESPTAANPAATADVETDQPGTLESPDNDEFEPFLKQRLDGGIGYSFEQFANLFLATSRLHLSDGIGLMTPSREIAATELQSPFPQFYKPTLREFLDAIAWQSFAEWKPDTSGKYIKSELDFPVQGPTIFEFTKTDRTKPFQVTLAAGRKAIDRGNWLMLVPPTFPVGLDIYEMGTYSADDTAEEKKLRERVPVEIALEWAQRVQENAAREDLNPGKVGSYDAHFFQAMIPSQLGRDVHWRQWVFMVENKCYFVVSTIPPEHETTIFPEVEKMLASFQIKQP